MISAPARSAHAASCSTAAARNVSPAASSTDFPARSGGARPSCRSSSSCRCRSRRPSGSPSARGAGRWPVVVPLADSASNSCSRLVSSSPVDSAPDPASVSSRSTIFAVVERRRPRRSAPPRAAPTSRRRASGRRWPAELRAERLARLRHVVAQAAEEAARFAPPFVSPSGGGGVAESSLDEQLAPGSGHGGGG